MTEERAVLAGGCFFGEKLSDLGMYVIRYGLVLVIFWIGAMKFTAYEANGIQPLVANSPLMGWLYGFLSVQTFSNLLGVVEIAIAVMLGFPGYRRECRLSGACWRY